MLEPNTTTLYPFAASYYVDKKESQPILGYNAVQMKKPGTFPGLCK